MNDKAHFNSMGNDFSVRFGLDDLSGRAQSALLRALLDKAGVLNEVAKGGEAEFILNKAIQTLWDK